MAAIVITDASPLIALARVNGLDWLQQLFTEVVVTDVVLAAPSAMFGYTNPLPLGMNDNVAAVALFGNGTQPFLGPVAAALPEWGAKTIDLCTATDPICSGGLNPDDPIGDFIGKWSSHLQGAYIDTGLVDQAADFIVGRL